jgi:hypothetical protein
MARIDTANTARMTFEGIFIIRNLQLSQPEGNRKSKIPENSFDRPITIHFRLTL